MGEAADASDSLGQVFQELGSSLKPLLPCSMEPVSQFQVETTCLIHLCTIWHHLRVLGIVQHGEKSLACQAGSRSPY